MKRYRYRKVTPEMLKEMRELYATGNYKQTEIAEMFGLGQSCANYWLNPKSREVSLKRNSAYNKKHPKKCDYKEARRDYQRERYQNDEEYRKRMIRHITKCQSNPEVKTRMNEQAKERYHRKKFVALMETLGIKRYI